MPRQQAQAKVDTKRSRAKSFRSKRRLAALRRRILGELAVYGGTFGFIANLLGLLGLSRLLNVSIAAASLVIVFVFRRQSTVLVLKTLYLQSAFYPYLYVVAFVLVLAIVGYLTFAAGKKAGYSAGVRSVLTALNLPTRPPPPRFPGDVNLDEYCRSRGPYQAMAPTDIGIFVQVPGSPPILGPLSFSKEQMAAIEARTW
jgi:predicted lysophospholipase L1 biosynthesis ABC-type transport system permease subunit